VEYKNIRDVKVTVANALEGVLGLGNVTIETPGSSENIVFSSISNPFKVQDNIYMVKGYKEKVDAIKKENDSKKEFTRWFTNVVTVLETKWLGNGAPNLQRLDYWSAVERANEFGLQVTAIGEDAVPELPPGLVVRQSPPPGTIISQGGEIQVYLSKRGR
jgi:hypothetical protein